MSAMKSAETQIELSGKTGVIALIAVVAFLGFRFATFDQNKDAELRQALIQELSIVSASDALAELKRVKESESGNYEEAVDLINPENIEIYSIYTSQPLLSYSSSQKVVVKVDYMLPKRKRRTSYYRFQHGLVSGWRFEGLSSSFSYYSNFF